MRQKTLPYTVKRFIKEFCMNELGMNGLGMNAWVMIITQSILPPIIEWVKTAVVLGQPVMRPFPKSAVNPLNRATAVQLHHLENRMENRGFGQANNNFNPAFDPFEDDYFNR
jgi:hypothetical protein